ncbi:MAG: MFS transporter [Alphaproteobacteria bacterium]|nr:MFS transporter [Alphaproteobacteria bacterium]
MFKDSNLALSLSVFRHGSFAYFVGGQTPSMVTHWMQKIGVGWLVWELTRSPSWLGVIAFVEMAPLVFMSPFTGLLCDRINPAKPLLINQCIQFLQASALAVLTFTGTIRIEYILVLSIIAGLNAPFGASARHTLLPRLIPREELYSGIALFSAIFNVARAIGPGLAGFAILWWGVESVFAIHAAGELFYILCFPFFMGAIPRPPEAGRGAIMAEIREGFRYAASHAGIAPVLVMLCAISFFSRPLLEMLPGFADAVFGRGAGGLAWLGASFGLGALIGVAWLASRGRIAGTTGVMLASSLGVGLTMMAFSATTTFWVALAVIGVMGFAVSVSGTGSQSLVQYAVASRIRGRVMALYTIIVRGSPAFGAALMGWFADNYGLRLAVGVSAVVCLAAWVWAHRRRAAMTRALESSDHEDGQH